MNKIYLKYAEDRPALAFTRAQFEKNWGHVAAHLFFERLLKADGGVHNLSEIECLVRKCRAS